MDMIRQVIEKMGQKNMPYKITDSNYNHEETFSVKVPHKKKTLT